MSFMLIALHHSTFSYIHVLSSLTCVILEIKFWFVLALNGMIVFVGYYRVLQMLFFELLYILGKLLFSKVALFDFFGFM